MFTFPESYDQLTIMLIGYVLQSFQLTKQYLYHQMRSITIVLIGFAYSLVGFGTLLKSIVSIVKTFAETLFQNRDVFHRTR